MYILRVIRKSKIGTSEDNEYLRITESNIWRLTTDTTIAFEYSDPNVLLIMGNMLKSIYSDPIEFEVLEKIETVSYKKIDINL